MTRATIPLDPIKQKAKARIAYNKWWAANREKLNRERHLRYQTDPEYRAQAVNRQARYRKAVGPLVRDGTRHRVIKGVKTQVFSMSQTAEYLRRGLQTIRNWEKAGLIPTPTVGGVHRCYTPGQVQLLQELVEIYDRLAREPAARAAEIKEKSLEIKSKWSKA